MRESLIADGVVSDNSSGIIIYGELFGGEYPHPSVPACDGSTGPVQCGCWYSPSLQFMAFDVAIALEEAKDVAFLAFDIAHAAATAAGLSFAEPLSRGTLAQSLGYNPRFTSTLPARLGLPPLGDDPNLAEGIVVRPAREPNDGSRRLVKIKIPEFSEKQYQNEGWRAARFGKGGSGGSGGSGGAGGAGAHGWADATATLRFEMLAAVSEQRLASVLSKIGRVEAADRAACRQLLDAFIMDVEEALVEDGLLDAAGQLRVRHSDVHEELERESRKLCAASLRAQQGQRRRAPQL